MTSRRRRLEVGRFALVALVATACSADRLEGPKTIGGGAADAVDSGAGPALTLAQACERVAKALCAPLGTCCDVETLRYDDASACVAAQRGACVAGSAAEADALASGAAALDAAALDACVAAIGAAGGVCQALDAAAFYAACWGIFVDGAGLHGAVSAAGAGVCAGGVVGMRCAAGAGVCAWQDNQLRCLPPAAQGEHCEVLPCATGLRCVEGENLAKRCAPPAPADGRCGVDDDCQSGLRCVDAGCVTAAARDGACGEGLPCRLGQRCDAGTCVDAGDLDAACADDDGCAPGLWCAGALLGQCDIRGDLGAPCLGHSQCGASFACDPSSKTCVARPKAGACVGGACALGYACEGQFESCVPLPGEASPCVAAQPPCADGLFCADGLCASPAGLGVACSHHDGCLAPLGCDPATKTCAALPKAGAGCVDGRCAPGAYCAAGGVCAAEHLLGEPCPDGLGCGGGNVCLLADRHNSRCVSPPKAGQACSFACAPGLFCRQNLGLGKCRRRLCLIHAIGG